MQKSPNGGIYLNKEGKTVFLRELEKKLYQKQTRKNQTSTYNKRINEEIQKIYRLVMYDEKYKPYKYY